MKNLLLVSLLAISSSVFATTGKDLTTSGSTAVSDSDCEFITADESVTIQLSNNVGGRLDCSASAAGVGTANFKGQGRSYGASSNGGKLTETKAATQFTDEEAAVNAAKAAATKAMGGGSGS